MPAYCTTKTRVSKGRTGSTKSQKDLEKALRQCRAAAKRGYRIARANLQESGETIDNVSNSLLQCLRLLGAC